jgi:hypothetical protein
VIIFRVSFTNFFIHLLEFVNILYWFFLLLQVKYEDLKKIDLQYFIEVQGLQGIRKDLKRLTNKDVCLLKMDQTMIQNRWKLLKISWQ